MVRSLLLALSLLFACRADPPDSSKDDSGTDSGAPDTGGDSACAPSDEVCNGLDDDCDGEIDEDALDASTWYVDADGDGYGDDSRVTTACEQPDGASDVNPPATTKILRDLERAQGPP